MRKAAIWTLGAGILSVPSLHSQQDPGTFRPDALPRSWPVEATTKTAAASTAPRASEAEIRQLLGNATVTLVRANQVFLPGEGGKAPRLVDGTDAWLVLEAGKVTGLVREPAEPVEIAPDAVKARMLDFTKDHPQSFAMPGLVDADSRWFLSSEDQRDKGTNAAVRAADLLETWEEGWEGLVREGGVTTVFVPASTASQSSGPGALVSLDIEHGARIQSNKGAVYFSLATLATKGTNLTRHSVAKALKTALEDAKKYREAQEKWQKDLQEYKKKRVAFLEYYKKNPLKPGEKVKEEPGQRRGRRGRGGRRGPMTKEQLERMLERIPPAQRERFRKRWEERMKRMKEEAAAQAKESATPKADATKKDPKKAPPRPAYPKKYVQDKAKEALLRVLDGKLALRVEAHRASEICALLEVAREFELAKLILVGATEAWRVAADLRLAGVAVVLSPHSLPDRGLELLDEHWATSAAELAAHGVRVAFGSAGKRRGRWLPVFAARAVAHGMPLEQALQGLTQNALYASGVDGQTAGVVVFSEEPWSAATKVLCVAKNRGVQMLGERK